MPRTLPRRRYVRGFTFIEIMLVVLIIGILMGIVVPRMVGQTRSAKIKACKASIHGIAQALSQFEVHAGRFPTTQEGLQALVSKPSGLSEDEWSGPYLNEIPKDPWGQEFIYRSPGEHNADFDLISKGPDKQENTPDDITNYGSSDKR
ncbi:MAG: type II secretion system major pseudopilin GspG [Candidatus Methanomethyliaceae archaeon]